MFSLATKRPVAVLMITCAAALFGVLSFRRLGLSLMPELSYPTLTVRTAYPAAAPEEVESELTRQIETRVGTVESLKAMSSSSRAGISEVVLEFDWDTDMDRAAQRVRERLGKLDLPAQVERPLLLRLDPTQQPVLSLAVSGPAGLARLRRYAVEVVEPALARVEGVAAVRVLGGEERAVEVRLSEAAIAARGLSVAQVSERLAAANVNLAGGRIEEGTVEYLVRTLADLKTPEEVAAIALRADEAGVLKLGDVAEVVSTVKARRSMVRVDGHEAVRVDVFRQADANIVEVCGQVKAVLANDAEPPSSGQHRGHPRPGKVSVGGGGRAPSEDLKRDRPPETALSVLSDQSVFIQASLDEVKGTAWQGGLLAVLLLALFLRSGYSTLVVAVAIPLSVAVTFIPMMLFGVSLNVMSLGGLALGVGMLVDNSVVVLESIFRCREEGDDQQAAAIRGTTEVGGAVIASTLTTVAVFFPITFVEGVAGQVFGDLALAVVFSLLASLAVALFVVPMLAAQTLVGAGANEGPTRALLPLDALRHWAASGQPGLGGRLVQGLRLPLALLAWVLALLANALILVVGLVVAPLWLGWWLLRFGLRWTFDPLAALFVRGVEGLKSAYGASLQQVLKRPLLLLVGLAVLGAGAAYSARDVGTTLIPEVRQGVLEATLRFPVGTPLEETDARSALLEAEVSKLPEVARVDTFVGEADDEGESERGLHVAVLTVRLKFSDSLEETEARVSSALRRLAQSIPDAELDLARPSLMSLKPPVRVVVLGPELSRLAAAAAQVHAVMVSAPSLTDVRTSVRPGFPELRVRFDRPRLAALGLSAQAVAEQLKGQLEGQVATTLRVGEQRLEVRVRLDPARIASREALRHLIINPEAEVPLPLTAVASIEEADGPAEIRRVDGQRAAVLSARTVGLDLGGAALRLSARLAALELPPGVELKLQGQDQEMHAGLRSLGFALLLAIFLVYAVMASQFESLRAPLVIMGTLPLAAIGVAWVLGAWGLPLSVVVFVGLITLAGIVVNNAIVLVDYANQLRARGLPLADALVDAGKARLRPILMTTLTTVLGLLPMAFGQGEGTELRRPMALTLMGGLIFAMVLTLVVIPVLFHRVEVHRG